MTASRVLPRSPAGNHLLDRLPRAEAQRLRPHLEPVLLAVKQILYEPGEPIRDVYFPTGAVVSLLAVVPGAAGVEAALVGREGVLGLPALLRAETSPQRAIVLLPGGALRVRAEALQGWAGRGGALARWLSRYISSRLTQVAQLAGCNAVHSLERRCCRWLLMACDRVGADELPLTHGLLAQMLGVRRADVTEVAGPLQERGLIRCHRGRVEILDRQRLAAAACECYRIIRDEYDRLLG